MPVGECLVWLRPHGTSCSTAPARVDPVRGRHGVRRTPPVEDAAPSTRVQIDDRPTDHQVGVQQEQRAVTRARTASRAWPGRRAGLPGAVRHRRVPTPERRLVGAVLRPGALHHHLSGRRGGLPARGSTAFPPSGSAWLALAGALLLSSIGDVTYTPSISRLPRGAHPVGRRRLLPGLLPGALRRPGQPDPRPGAQVPRQHVAGRAHRRPRRHRRRGRLPAGALARTDRG